MKRLLLIIAQIILLALLVYVLVSDFTDLIREPYHRIFRSVVVFMIVIVGARAGMAFLELLYKRKYPDRNPKRDTLIIGLQNVYYIILVLAILLLVLQFFGVDPKTLFTSLSIVAAAIAIVTKDFLVEIVSGILMSFSNYLRIDDYVKINDTKGKILNLGLQKTTFLSDDESIITLPNSKVYTGEVVNYTLSDQRRMSIEFQMSIVNLESIEKLESDIIESITEFHQFIEAKSYDLRVSTIATNHLDLKFLYTLKKLDRELTREIRKKVARKLVNFIKQQNKIDFHIE